MAITATLVFSKPNHIRYLINASVGGGEQVFITTTGAVSPDLITDSVAGPIKALARVKTDGYGKIPAGGVVLAQGRALWLSDAALTTVGAANTPPTAIAQLAGRSVSAFTVDAGLGPADVQTTNLTVTANAVGIVYLDVTIPGAIGA